MPRRNGLGTRHLILLSPNFVGHKKHKTAQKPVGFHSFFSSYVFCDFSWPVNNKTANQHLFIVPLAISEFLAVQKKTWQFIGSGREGELRSFSSITCRYWAISSLLKRILAQSRVAAGLLLPRGFQGQGSKKLANTRPLRLFA